MNSNRSTGLKTIKDGRLRSVLITVVGTVSLCLSIAAPLFENLTKSLSNVTVVDHYNGGIKLPKDSGRGVHVLEKVEA